MRRSVGRRISEEHPARARWAWLAPLAAGAALAAALMLTTWRAHSPSAVRPAPGLAAWSALPDAGDDPSLAVMEGFAAEDDALATFDEGAGVGSFLASLSDEDDQALAASLRTFGKGGES
jgi:hypothetical protein